MPEISLVTPTFNQVDTLGETLESVLRQGVGDELEYIVVDACSSDGTEEIVRKFESIAVRQGIRFRYIRERDQGQADAVNKGWRVSTGGVFGFLNSDDLLEAGSIRRVLDYFLAYPSVQWAYGGWNLIGENGYRYATVSHSKFDRNRLLNYCNIGQPSCFFRGALLQEFGFLDEELHLAMDYDLWLRFSTRYPAGIIPHVLSSMRYHPGAKSARQTIRQVLEIYRIGSRYTPPASLRRLLQMFYCLRGLFVSVLGVGISNRISLLQRVKHG